MKDLIFLNSHPIQYYVPLYRDITKDNFVNLTVVYCSNESIIGKKDQEFGVDVKWDVPLLEGYNYFFLRNFSIKPSIHKGFWGLMNWGIVPFLFRQPKSIVVVLGWAHFTSILAIVFGKIAGHTICLRGDTPFHQEKLKNRWITRSKHIYLKLLFKWIDYFLYVGYQNKLFYQSMGIKKNRLVFAPHSVDNDSFQNVSSALSKDIARKYLGLPLDVKIILFSAKYIPKKRPMDLLMAFKRIKDRGTLLVMMGEGSLRAEMEQYIAVNQLQKNVILTGFINQSEIVYYYKSADLFVMCSGLGETWGLSVNEAMNFELPVVVSETTGCSYDLVKDNENGFVFQTGDINALAAAMESVLSEEEKCLTMGRKSKDIIDEYSNRQMIIALKGLLNSNP